MKAKFKKALPWLWYSLWAFALWWGYRAAKELGVWNGDVFLNGLSLGILVMVIANRFMRWADAEHARLVARGVELDNQLKRLAWNTYKAIHRLRREDMH